jgi:hypothetical protein
VQELLFIQPVFSVYILVDMVALPVYFDEEREFCVPFYQDVYAGILQPRQFSGPKAQSVYLFLKRKR